MAKYGPDIGPNIGNSTRMPTANGPHNFQRSYYKSAQSSGTGIRVHYEDLQFTGTIGGEVIRARGIANGLLCATLSTINAAHFTGRVEAAKTVSGALNAVRATLEVAGNAPTPGGTLAALQLDVNAVASTVWGNEDAYIRVTNTGSTGLTNLFNLPAAGAASAYLSNFVVANHDTSAPATWNYAIKIRIGGVNAWIPVTTDTPND